MNRPIALAYAITGLAVAVSIAAVVAATSGVFAPAPADVTTLEPVPQASVPGMAVPATPATGAAAGAPGAAGSTIPAAQSTGTEFVYVDAPRSARGGEREEHERGEREEHERGEREEDDDD